MGLRRRKFVITGKIVVWVFFAVLILLFILTEHNLRSTIISFAETQARWMVNQAIHRAVLENVAANTRYSDLIHVELDRQGRVAMLHADVTKINRFTSDSALRIQSAMEELKYRNVRFPLGQVLGSKLLASYGPGIRLSLLPVGTVEVTVNDEFESAGINQTRHRIYLHIKSKIKVLIPFMEREVEVVSRVPIADTIIVGDVPSTYFYGNWGVVPMLPKP